MNLQYLPAVIAGMISVLGLAANCAWAVYNARMENRVLSHIDELKTWADDRFRQRPVCEDLMKVVGERLARAGV